MGYPINRTLCVLPSGTESQFEAFQAIIAAIMNASPDSPYYLLLEQSHIPLFELPSSSPGKKADGIYYQKPVGGSTHYIAYKDGKRHDPYDSFQPRGTQGFCQLFAYFMYLQDLDGFIPVTVETEPTTKDIRKQKKKVSPKNFLEYSQNTYQCLLKFLHLMNENVEVRKQFQTKFLELKKNDKKQTYGIKKTTTFPRFLDDLSKLDLASVQYYIYDNPLIGWKTKSPRPALWKVIAHSSLSS